MLLLLLCPLGLLSGRAAARQQAEKQPVRLLVHVPAAARLTIDGHETTHPGEVRRFESPPVATGKTYTYLLKASWFQGERQIVRMAVAEVRAGKETVVDLRPGSKDASSSQIIYVPTPQHVVEKMLEMALVTKDDLVYDLGCGDGRVVVTAAKKYGSKGVGVDIDPARVKEALANAEKEKVRDLVEIRHGDALKVPDLSRATVVMLYMLPEFMEKLKPILLKQLRPGTRVVAHDYPLPGWQADETLSIPGGTRIYAHTLYLWRVPGPKKK
jgi:uncharacterized protein (TIGR03000 family)